MAIYGNAGSLSSLLSAASAARKRQESLQDSIASYEWDLSPKTVEDYSKYSKLLGERSKSYSATDPQKSLEYQKKITAAQRGLASQEITRAGMAIMEGRGTKMDKLNKFSDLARQAYETGDGALYQRLTSAGEALQIQIQNEQYAAGQAAIANGERASANYEKQLKFDTDTAAQGIQDEIKMWGDMVKKGGNTALGDIENTPGPDGKRRTYFEALHAKTEELKALYQKSANSTTDPEKKAAYLKEFNDIVSGKTKFSIDGKNTVSQEDMVRQIQARNMGGQNATRLSVNADGTFEIKDNYITSQKAIRGADGKIVVQRGYDASAADTSVGKAKLKELGYDVSDDNGMVRVKNKQTGQDVVGLPDENGNILYQAGVDANGNAIMRRFVADGGKDEAVSEQEIDAAASPEAQLKEGLTKSDASIGKFLNRTNANKMEADYRKAALDTIQQMQQLGYADLADKASEQLKFAAGGGGGLLGLGSPIASLQKKLSELQAEAAVRSQAKADRDFITSNPSAGSVVFKPQNGQVLNPSKAVQAGIPGAKAPAVIQDFLGGGNRFSPTNSFGQTNLLTVGGMDRTKAYSIINNSSNYGGAVAELQKAGYNPSTYDEELRTANNNQGGANKSGITSRFR